MAYFRDDFVACGCSILITRVGNAGDTSCIARLILASMKYYGWQLLTFSWALVTVFEQLNGGT